MREGREVCKERNSNFVLNVEYDEVKEKELPEVQAWDTKNLLEETGARLQSLRFTQRVIESH